jgi:hypothetical protein
MSMRIGLPHAMAVLLFVGCFALERRLDVPPRSVVGTSQPRTIESTGNHPQNVCNERGAA